MFESLNELRCDQYYLKMANGHQKAAAARARAAWLARKARTSSNNVCPPHGAPLVLSPESPPIAVKSESESECGYNGGVNCIWSEPDSHTAGEHEPSDNERMSDMDESLEELEGTDLEENLKALRDDIKSGVKSGYAKVAAPKTVEIWQKAEKN
ncbi:uncharacterized protein EDB91DRAFT_1083910 [Suillus paluster]|uniref:uncharacterized protein n=1 Tax=Suillus paluster TaxID=48578 RepID=UPI001B88011E|nr:uncharacterized protein EDB91DRAFT_1083910 [Suillus paluster]KAG1734898.1 hypothetical protein EDB91DRAFT_1083910 [Suillus paluster]